MFQTNVTCITAKLISYIYKKFLQIQKTQQSSRKGDVIYRNSQKKKHNSSKMYERIFLLGNKTKRKRKTVAK